MSILLTRSVLISALFSISHDLLWCINSVWSRYQETWNLFLNLSAFIGSQVWVCYTAYTMIVMLAKLVFELPLFCMLPEASDNANTIALARV